MKLLPRYATECCLQIGKQELLETFFPLPFFKYVTIHPSSGQNAAKNYPYYQLVIELIKPYLDKENIHIVQIGSKDDIALQNLGLFVALSYVSYCIIIQYNNYYAQFVKKINKKAESFNLGL